MFIRHILKTTASSESVNSAVEIGMSIRTTAYGFIPTQITGCQLWLDAADSSSFNSGSISTGNTITSWSDKSGKNQSITVGGSPVWNSTTLNNSPSVNTTNGRFSGSFSTPLSSFTNTTFVVTSLTSYPTGGYPCVAFQNTTSAGAYFLRILDYAGGYRFIAFFSSLGLTATQTASLATPFLWTTTYGGSTSASLNVNGGSSISATFVSPGSSAAYFYVGTEQADVPNVNTWPGYVSEVIVYNSVLSATQQQQVESYLAQKWGITLATGHPGLTTTVYQSTYLKTAGPKMNIARMTPFYTAFSPQQIGGLALWLDAADSSTITGTSPVTQWRDKSVNNYSMTYTGSPTYRTTAALNNLGCITFNGTTSFNSGTDTMYWSAFSISQPFTVFVVCTKRLSSNTNFSFVLEPSTSSGSVILYGGLQLKMYAGSADQYTNPILAFVANSTQIYSAVFNGASSLLAYGGNATSSLNPGTASWPSLYLGRDWGGVYDSGDYGEILFYNSALSTTQRQQVESYLAQKWGLTSSLPAGHLQYTQPAGAVTALSLANSKLKITSRSTPFLPTSVGGLNGIQLWMDASDSSSASMTLSGSTVTVWKDKSGCGNNTTAYSSTPTLTSSAINGKSAISMGGGYFTGPFATANTGSQIHAFAVLTIDSSGTGAWPRPLSLGRPGANDYSDSTTTFAIIRYSGTQAVGIGRNGQYLSASFPSYSSPFLVQSSHNGSTEYISVNGTLTPSSFNDGQSGNFNITSYGLGVNTNTGDYFTWSGYYGEVIYYNTQLSDTDRQKVEGYLAWKWGIQATLPGGHPYASAAP